MSIAVRTGWLDVAEIGQTMEVPMDGSNGTGVTVLWPMSSSSGATHEHFIADAVRLLIKQPVASGTMQVSGAAKEPSSQYFMQSVSSMIRLFRHTLDDHSTTMLVR